MLQADPVCMEPEMNPVEAPRRILLCATGLSPQVVTETVHALATGPEPRFVPTEVHVITTTEGAHRIRLKLLEEGEGRFAQLLRDWDLPAMRFDADHVHVIGAAEGQPRADIHDAAANTLCADLMLRLVAEFTADPDSALHVSIAGGRKTMGYLLGYTLTLCGRPRDRLSHVLVDADYESLPDFFYPTPQSLVLTSRRDDRPIDARDARVTLAEIPFVPLSSGLTEAVVSRDLGFGEAVARVRNAVRPGVAVDPRRRTLAIGGNQVQLSVRDILVWYRVFQLMRDTGGGLDTADLLQTDAAVHGFTAALMAELPEGSDVHDAAAEMALEWTGDAGEAPLKRAVAGRWLREGAHSCNRKIRAMFGEAGLQRIGLQNLHDRKVRARFPHLPAPAAGCYVMGVDPAEVEVL